MKTRAAAEEIVWLGDLPIATIQGGAAYTIAPDHLGAPHQIVNSSNTQVWFWNHDPFGNGAPSAAAGFAHRLRYPGQVYDAETGLHSNGHRDYDPRLGRYVESDPIGLEGGINTYAYAGNDPVNAIDPLGLDPKSNESNACRAAGGNAAGGGGVIAIPAPSGLGGAGAAEGAGLGAALLSRLGLIGALLSLSGDTVQNQPQFLNHYTTAAGYSGISASGMILPSSNGLVYLTPDVYSTGGAAQASLALSNTPVGYFQVPTSNISGASPPSTVQPWNGQPGGGIEITVPSPVSIKGAKWSQICP